MMITQKRFEAGIDSKSPSLQAASSLSQHDWQYMQQIPVS